MTIQMNITDPDFSLLDAVAYEYFMDNLNQCIEVNSDDGADVLAQSVELLAELSFCIGEMFVQKRLSYLERKHKKEMESND
jgi:hypothetical protein